MAEIGFYHLLSTPLERALPKLLERARAHGHPIVVRCGSAERVAQLDAVLWTYEEASFLPHGSARDGDAASQPIWLTDRDENPNRATMLVLVDGVEAERPVGLCALRRHVRRQRRRRGRRRARALAPGARGRPRPDLLAADRDGLGAPRLIASGFAPIAAEPSRRYNPAASADREGRRWPSNGRCRSSSRTPRGAT